MLLIALALICQLAEAKTILYVTNTSTDTSCSALQAADSLYCNRLINLGYSVKVINELHVRDNSTTWNEYADISDIIFLGNDGVDLANKTRYRNIFCGNISAKSKPLFITSTNAWISKTKNIEGCAFYPTNLVTFNFSDNKCSTKTFKVAKTGFITEGFNLDDNITIYSVPKSAKIYDSNMEGWITSECIPPNGSIDFYPVIFTSTKGVFWGLDEPASFSNLTWDIFDRTILYFLNDTEWSITAFALPSVATMNQDILIFANVTQNGKQVKGTVNLTADSLTKNMNYDSLWKAVINLSEERQYNLNLAAYSQSLRGTTTLPISVGSLAVNIISDSFKPNMNYTVSAEAQEATSASYRILNSSTYVLISQGTLTCGNDVCTGITEIMLDTPSLLLEVTASGNGRVGGALKKINKETLSTNKDIYKPGDVIKIDFFSSEPLTNVSLTITRPDGTKEIPSLPMDKISSNYWNKNYSLGTGSLNGIWIVSVKTNKGNFNKNISIIAWSPFAYLNKNNFDIFENLILTAGTTGAYSNSLDLNVTAEVTEPDGSLMLLGNAIVKGNSDHNFSYMIPKGYPSGTSTIKISFKDTDNRSSVLFLNFSTNITLLQPSLFVTPSTISITTVRGRIIEQTISLENDAQINSKNIITNTSGMEMTVTAPDSLEPKGKASVTIRIDTSSLPEGTYTGNVNFYSLVGDAQTAITMEIIGDLESLASQKYSDLTTIETNLTYLKKFWMNTTNASELLNETRDALNETIKEYKKENYALAKTKFEEASSKATELETSVNDLYQKIPDYSFIIWDFAAAVVVIIVTVSIIKIKGRKKKSKVQKKEVKKGEPPPKEEVFFEPKGGEYRTEYY